MTIERSQKFTVGGPRATYVLVICSLLSAVRYADWQVMSVVLQSIKTDLGLSDSEIGLANAAFFVGVIVFTIPISHLVDIWSRKKMIGLVAVVWSAFTLGTAFAGGVAMLAFMRFGVGVGEAGFAPGGTALVSASYPESKRAQKLGIFNMFITIGVIVGVVGGGILSAKYGGWRTPFMVFAIPGIALGFLAFFMQDYRLVPAKAHGSLIANLKALFAIRTLPWLYIGLGMYAVLQISVGTWFPSLLIRAYAIGEDKAGLVMGVVTLVGLIGPIAGGVIADRWRHRHAGGRMRLAAISIAIASLFVWLVLLAAFDTANRALMIFCAAMMPLHSIAVGMSLPAVAATTQDVVPARLRGLSWGVAVVALYLLGGAWGPLLVGAVSDHMAGGYVGLAVGLAITGIFGLVAAWMWWQAARFVDADTSVAQSAPA